jgi:choline-sulfatase
MADQHRADALGALGHPHVKTPSLDRLAAGGCVFENAYCNSPICGPSRASMITGRYPSEIQCYGNASVYPGSPDSVAHHLKRHGRKPYSIGRMDFKLDCDHGFDAQSEGPRKVPAIAEFFRRPSVRRLDIGRRKMLNVELTEDRPCGHEGAACSWLQQHRGEEGWFLFLNFLQPHSPFRVPRKYFELFGPRDFDLPVGSTEGLNSQHPAIQAQRRSWNMLEDFSEEDTRRQLAGYYAMIAWLDQALGRIFDALHRAGLEDNTLVIYTSDHGENAGDRGLWGKANFYDSAARVPMIASGPGVKRGSRVQSPVSLIDLAPTISQALDAPADPAWRGASLLPLAHGEQGDHPQRAVGEYHGPGAHCGQSMIRKGRFKYIHHACFEPQLFDLEADPCEESNLAGHPEYGEVLGELRRELYAELGDLEENDRRARRFQEEWLRRWTREIGVEAMRTRMLEYLDPSEKGRVNEFLPEEQ